MRRVRYQVACSLDGFIAGEDDDYSWIPPEPSFDFDELYAQFSTLLMERRTYEVVRSAGESFRGKEVIVASHTPEPKHHPEFEVVNDGLEARVYELRNQDGDIWLYGGGKLFSQLLDWGLVDTVEPAIIPILLGGGVPSSWPHLTLAVPSSSCRLGVLKSSRSPSTSLTGFVTALCATPQATCSASRSSTRHDVTMMSYGGPNG